MWGALFDGTFPPGSVSGAPKASALRIIAREEPVARGPYCGAIGWIDADAGTAELAVGIRTFWWDNDAGGTLRFGTGAGITWGSEPAAEWEETRLKARRLIALASTDTMST
jgi:para-aminobenzoate synthetase component 1